MSTVYSVTRLNNEIKELLDAVPGYRSLLVQGEISNYKAHSSGHHYMTLKDENAAINAVMFRSDAMRLKFRLENGLQVIVRARVSSFPRTGQVQLYISEVIPAGAGALSLAFEQLKNRLQAEGLFDPAQKKPIPPCPQRIALVTSPTGAAVRDMIRILGRRWPLAKVTLYPAQVQGQGAAESIARALALANAVGEADVILCGRGGGSMEDLWAFNEEVVARAIHDSTIPVISAVGHEPDVTIADFAADLRAPTPSGAAELAVPDRADCRAAVRALDARLHTAGAGTAGGPAAAPRRALRASGGAHARPLHRGQAHPARPHGRPAVHRLSRAGGTRAAAAGWPAAAAGSRRGERRPPPPAALCAGGRHAGRGQSARRARPRLRSGREGQTRRGGDRRRVPRAGRRAAHPICQRRGELPRDRYRGGSIYGRKDV